MGAIFTDYRNTCDIEVQHAYTFKERQSLTWGGGVMTSADNWPNTFTFSFVPDYRRDTTPSAFLQYDLDVIPGTLRVVAGSKFEHNNYTGFEYQPQLRVVWTPTKSHAVWAGVSRAVRTPTRVDSDIRGRASEISLAPPTFLVFTGDPDAKSEVLHAYELGYRYDWKQKFSFDGTIYYNHYDHLASQSAPGAPVITTSPLYVDIPVYDLSTAQGQTHGLDAFVNYTPVRRWRLSTGLTELYGSSTAGVGFPAAAFNPKHQVNVQSRLDLTRDLNFDAAYYYYDAIAGALPTVNRVDLGVSTNSVAGFTLSVWGRNLQEQREQQAIAHTFLGGEIRRSVVFKLIWESNSNQGIAKH